MKCTRWYPAHIKPIRVGWYECNLDGLGVRYWWDGALWLFDPGNYRQTVWFQERIKWRGLTAPMEVSNG